MKSFIIIIIFSSLIYGQNFFPLRLGNIYLFEQDTDWNTYYRVLQVQMDSVINSTRYFKFDSYSQGPFPGTSYFHYDMSDQKLFVKLPGDDTIRLAVDFRLPKYGWITSYITGFSWPFQSDGIERRPLWGDSVLSFRMMGNYNGNYYEYVFSENIGTNFYFHLSQTGAMSKLISAIVDTSVFNRIYLDLYNIEPLINRPVAAFPFVISGSYYTNFNMVDSFYVEVRHLRNNDTLGTYYYPFNQANNTQIPLFPLVGDKLLVRGFISDNTIFYNHDVFPDTGYAEILVLPDVTGIDDYKFPYTFSLDQNYPNPFNPLTTIHYNIPEGSFVSLIIYDIMGNEIDKPVNEEKQSGAYFYQFDGSGLSSGVYFYKLTAGGKTDFKKMILMK